MESMSRWFDRTFSGRPVMAILRGYDLVRSVAMAEAAWDLGVRAVEVPVQSADAVASLRAVVSAGADRGAQVGAGTVTTIERVRAAAEAGAVFTVAPGLDPAVVAASQDAGLPHLPGVATATEIQAAMRLGLTWVKAFPAVQLGTGWFEAQRGPFPGVHLVATGGIDADNAASYLECGADVVAVGSALADAAQLCRLASLLRH